MTCTRFELGARGSLAIMREGHTLIYLWPDEIDRLKTLLARPTPAHVVNQSLSDGASLPAAVHLLNDGSVMLAFAFEVRGFEGVTLDAKHANQLRYALGVFAPREGEPIDALAQSALESWGPAEDRLALLGDRIGAAWQPARGEGTRW